MSDAKPSEAREHEFAEMVDSGETTADVLGFEDLKDVRLAITADLGRAPMLVRELLELKEDSVITLDRVAGEMTDVLVNGIHLGRGEVVVIADSLHIRLNEIAGLREEDVELGEGRHA